MTKVRDVTGLPTALPDLRTLTMRGCRSFREARQLAGLTRLTTLDLGWTGLRNLKGLTTLPALTALDLSSCASLTTLEGIDALTRLTELRLTDCRKLATLTGLGSHPGMAKLTVDGCSALRDARGLGALTGLTYLRVKDCAHLTTLGGLQGSTIDRFRAEGCPALADFSALEHVPGLRGLDALGLDSLTDLSQLPVMPAMDHMRFIECPSLRALDGIRAYPLLRKLMIWRCHSGDEGLGDAADPVAVMTRTGPPRPEVRHPRGTGPQAVPVDGLPRHAGNAGRDVGVHGPLGFPVPPGPAPVPGVRGGCGGGCGQHSGHGECDDGCPHRCAVRYGLASLCHGNPLAAESVPSAARTTPRRGELPPAHRLATNHASGRLRSPATLGG